MENSKKYGKPTCRFKADITKVEYSFLISNAEHYGDWSQAVYLYYDSSHNQREAKLFSNGLRLRVRIKYGNYSIELKSRANGDRWEISQPISADEFRLMSQDVFPAGKVSDKLAELGFLSPLTWIGAANTLRKKVHFHEGILIIDQTDCCNKNQLFYQVEFRSDKVSLPYKIKNISDKINLLMRSYFPEDNEIWSSTTEEL